MDWWPAVAIEEGTSLTFNPASALVQAMDDDPNLSQQIRGYLLWDEPDMSGTYRSLATLRAWHTAFRERDSTRPIYMNFGWWPVRNQGFAWGPEGASPQFVNELWREQQELTDVLCCDDYQWIATSSDGNTGIGGVWEYAAQVKRLGEIDDDRKPKWVIVETTSQIGDAVPDPADVDKAIWAGIIAGARGIAHRRARPGDRVHHVEPDRRSDRWHLRRADPLRITPEREQLPDPGPRHPAGNDDVHIDDPVTGRRNPDRDR
jgi:hypothetical protein